MPRYVTRATATTMTTNSTEGLMVAWNTSSLSRCDAYMLVRAIPAGTNSA